MNDDHCLKKGKIFSNFTKIGRIKYNVIFEKMFSRV